MPFLLPTAERVLAGERDAHVRKLRERADRLEKLTPEEFLVAEPLEAGRLNSYELTKMLADAGWLGIHYDQHNRYWTVTGFISGTVYERRAGNDEVYEKLNQIREE